MANWVQSSDVMKIYNISRPTLKYWVSRGWIKTKLINAKRFAYDLDSVLLGDDRNGLNEDGAPIAEPPRINIIYARIPTNGTKTDLVNQLVSIKSYTTSRNIRIDKTLIDIDSGISSDRKEFNNLLKLVIQRKVDKVYLLSRDRLSRFGFNVLELVFSNFGTKIEFCVADEFQDETLVQELFEDLETLLKSYCMKVSGDSQAKLNEIIEFLSEE